MASLYQQKLVSAEAAMRHIKPGDRVFIGSACGEPQHLVRAMVEHGKGTTDTEVIQVLSMGVTPYTDPRYADRFRANAFFIGHSVRDAVQQSRADYTPVFFSQVPRLFRSRRIPIDVALIMVSQPDEFGMMSMGVSVDITRAAAESARVVIAQVNKHMPRAMGDCFLRLDQIDYVVEHDEPLLEWPKVEHADDVTHEIARHIARLVSDGDTLQIGIGKLPDAILDQLTDQNDLGIHTEMFSDGVMHLTQRGVITGRRKTLDRGKIVASFAAGSHELFQFMHNNPLIEMHPSEYTNNPRIIAEHDNIVAINAAIEVDLTGQVVADSIGDRLYSGIGGHADFIRGSAMALHGKPVITLPSTVTTSDGIRSRIVAAMPQGAGVTNSRGDAHYIVTEYGIAYLHGRNMRERAMALINVAHPDFRTELLQQAKGRKLVYLDQILPPREHRYPAELETSCTLRDGTRVDLRPIRPDDETRIKGMFYSFSEQTKYLRYHGTLKAMPHERLQEFCNIDYDTQMILVAVLGPTEEEQIIGVGGYVTDASHQKAELAFVVRDDWQRKGLGGHLFRRLVEIARGRGIQSFYAEVIAENSGMLRIFHSSDMKVQTHADDGVVSVTMQAVG